MKNLNKISLPLVPPKCTSGLGFGLRVKIFEVLPTTDCQKMLEQLVVTRPKNEKHFRMKKT